MIAVKKELQARLLDTGSCIEILWVLVQLSCVTCAVGVCYRPPDSKETFVNCLNESLSLVYDRFPGSPVILAGDFNYPGINWRTGTADSGARIAECKDFLDVISSYGLSQIVSMPTRGDAILDLVLTTEPSNMSVNVLDCISDHNVIHCEFKLTRKESVNEKKTIYDYARADVEMIYSELSSFCVEFFNGMQHRDSNENWMIVCHKLIELKEKYIPKIHISVSTGSAWFTSHVKRCINKKKRFYSRAKTLQSDDAWKAYREQSQLCKTEIEAAKDKFFNHDISNMLTVNTKKFWKVINPKPSSSCFISIMQGNEFLPPSEVATAFNSFFCSVFSRELPITDNIHLGSVTSIMEDIVITEKGIEAAIDRLSSSSAPGPDGICPKLLKLTKPVISPIFACLFQQSIQSGCVPDGWKVSKIVPIFKSGDPSSVTNYRPISLTSIPCKLLEHIISSAIMKYLTKHNHLFSNQHGFQQGRSCETQLFELVSDIYEAVNDSSQIDAIFIDFAKAFDKVAHNRLLQKLRYFNIHSQVVNWIRNFLTDRYQFVTANEFSSSRSLVKSGVPQGSVLGPILFLLYVNDISNSISSTVRLFADDCVIYRRITTTSDSDALQSDLAKIADWCEQWQMEINTSKTKAVAFTRVSNPKLTHYLINDSVIARAHTIKYLGVHLSSNISWSDHIEAICSSACKTLGFIRRNLYLANKSTKLLAYETLVRAKLEYASFIWNPHQSYLINKLEAIQNKATRFITKDYSRTSSITNLKKSLNLSTLENRRIIALLSHFHKLYHSSSSFRVRHITAAHRIFPRLDHPFKVQPVFARTNFLSKSPLFLAIYHWNKLPADVVSSQNHEDFMNKLKSYFNES